MNDTLHVFHSAEFRGVVRDALTFFEKTPTSEMPPSGSFNGCGVYGIYYTGGYPLYAKIGMYNAHTLRLPIYIGKAVPSGWRTGREQWSEEPKLYQRLQEHARSIQQTSNLRLADFHCRFVILKDMEVDLLVPLEAELIRRYQPLWNTYVDGFGNHDPGAGRYNQAQSEWDVIHPGRAWAKRLTGNAPRLADIRDRVQKILDELTLS